MARRSHARTGLRRAKVVGNDGDRIPLAGLSIHGAWHAFGKVPQTKGPWHQYDLKAARF